MSQLPIFLRGKKTILRPLNKKTDLEQAWRWINDPEVNQYLVMHLPQTREQEEEFFARIGKDDRNVVLAIEALAATGHVNPTRRFIGIMGIHQISWKDRVATTGALIGEKEFWGKGYGTDAKMVLLDYAFHQLNLNKVCSAVVGFNERSVRYSLRCGYQIEGTRRDHVFRNGRYWDLIELGVLREEWKPLWERY